MHVSPAKHSYAWLPRKCDYRTERHTDGRTDRRRTKWSLCATMLRRRQKTLQEMLVKYLCRIFPQHTRIGYTLTFDLLTRLPIYLLKCYKNEHSFEICHWTWSLKLSCKILRRYDQRFSRKWHLKLLFLVIFRIFPNWNCHFRSGSWKSGCDVVRLYVLQSYRSCTFCKRKTRDETQCWIKLAAPCTLTNHNEINFDDTLPFIIVLTSVSCDGSNRLWHQRLLLSPCSLWRHKQTLIGVIRPLAGGICRTFRRVFDRYHFHRYLCFHFVFSVRFFCILFCANRVTISY